MFVCLAVCLSLSICLSVHLCVSVCLLVIDSQGIYTSRFEIYIVSMATTSFTQRGLCIIHYVHAVQAVGGTNLPTQSVKPLTLPSSTPVSIPPPTVQMGLQGSDSQQLLGTGLTGGLPTGDSFTSGLLAGMKHHSQLQTIQPSRSALPLAQPATSVRQDAIPGMDHVFTKEIEDEANSYFQRIYNCKMPLDAVLETLKMFKNSTNQKEKVEMM